MSFLFLQYPPMQQPPPTRLKNGWMTMGISYEARHIKEQNPTAAELETWYKKSGFS